MPAVGTVVTLMWLPTGIAVAFVFREGYRYLPAVAVGSFLVNLVTGQGWIPALGISVGNTLAPFLTVWLLHQLDFHHHFQRTRDIVYLSLAGHVGMLVSASGGVAVLVLTGALTDGVLKAWLCWWAGDSMGVVAAAPLLLVASRVGFEGIRRRGAEFIGWLIPTILILGGVFVLNSDVNSPPWPLAFVPLPLLAWATIRFGPMGNSLAVILISLSATYGTSIRSGPFYRPDAMQQTLMLWIYMATAAVLGWLISSLRSAQVRAVGIHRALELALDAASLGVLITDRNRRFTYANEGFVKLTGYQPEEVIGRDCRLLHGEKTDMATFAKLRSDLDQFGHFDGEIVNYRKDGSLFWNALLVITINDENGQPIGFLGIQRDITARKEAEIALQQSEARLRTILNLEPECVKIVSADGRLLDMNPAGLAMIEADSIEQVRGSRIEELIESDYRIVFRRTHQAVLAGGTGQCEFAIRALKGTRRWLQSNAVPYRDSNGQIVGQLAVTRDITESRRIEDQVRASLREKEAMLKEIHHRVKNNLQIISSLLNLQVETVDDAATRAALRGSQNRVRSMAMIHESLYQSGNLGRIDLSEYVGELCRHLCRSYGVDVSVIQLCLNIAHASLDLERAIPFGLIINELVSNAIKYAFPEGRPGRINVGFEIAQKDCYILSVSDDGIGLPMPFDMTRFRSLGLQLVQDLVHQLSGTLTIQQSPHAEFLITFPLLSSDHGGRT